MVYKILNAKYFWGIDVLLLLNLYAKVQSSPINGWQIGCGGGIGGGVAFWESPKLMT